MPRRIKGQSEVTDWLRTHLDHPGGKCLIWPFSRNWNGYGQIAVERKITYAHRVMCEMVNGPAVGDKCIAAHTCNNGHGGCVHPRHLMWKTRRENLLDRRAAGTIPKNTWTKYGAVTQEEIAEIVALKGTLNQREIAAKFGISYQHVSIIQQGKLVRQRTATLK